MKKILFTLLMLCSMTAAWAEGLGDGTKERPFTGEWQISELKSKLKEGVYLAFDCVIKGTQINVTDIRLKRKIADDWTDWAPQTHPNPPCEGGGKYSRTIEAYPALPKGRGL